MAESSAVNPPPLPPPLPLDKKYGETKENNNVTNVDTNVAMEAIVT